MKSLTEVLNIFRKQGEEFEAFGGKYVGENPKCDHFNWCDWMPCSPFCIDCGWGMPTCFLKEHTE